MNNQLELDKYEGHTPAKGWRMADGSAMFMQSANNNADAELMADAPLLLAEVKRLREQLAKAKKYVYIMCRYSDSILMDYEDYIKGDEEE